MKDYYYILGLTESAQLDEIKRAYRKLSTKFHPDKNKGDRFFEDRFKDIQEAYECLSNEVLRHHYDLKRNIFFGKTKREKINEEPKEEYPPEILEFSSDKDSIYEGDIVNLTWKTINADEVKISCFKGPQEPNGTKKTKITGLREKDKIRIRIKATNSKLVVTNTTEITLTSQLYEDIKNHFSSREDINPDVKESNLRDNEISNNKSISLPLYNVKSCFITFIVTILVVILVIFYAAQKSSTTVELPNQIDNIPYRTFKVGEDLHDIPKDKTQEFFRRFPNAVEVKIYIVGKDTTGVPVGLVDRFIGTYPNAVLLNRNMTDNVIHPPDETQISNPKRSSDQQSIPKVGTSKDAPLISDLSKRSISNYRETDFKILSEKLKKDLGQFRNFASDWQKYHTMEINEIDIETIPLRADQDLDIEHLLFCNVKFEDSHEQMNYTFDQGYKMMFLVDKQNGYYQIVDSIFFGLEDMRFGEFSIMDPDNNGIDEIIFETRWFSGRSTHPELFIYSCTDLKLRKIRSISDYNVCKVDNDKSQLITFLRYHDLKSGEGGADPHKYIVRFYQFDRNLSFTRIDSFMPKNKYANPDPDAILAEFGSEE